MKICYQPHAFGPSALGLLRMADKIIRQYRKMGFQLTVRQLYYQFVARDIIPNTPKSYNRMQDLLSVGRLAGEIDWESIVDRTRNATGRTHWACPADIVTGAAAQYRINRWTTQPYYLEVWVEKDALIDVVQRVAHKWDVTSMSCRGYTSQSAMYEAAGRFRKAISEGKKCVLIQLSDHDPSGVDMSRDIQERFEMFRCPQVQVVRVGLTMEQVRQYNPPPNPAKESDARYADYEAKYGNQSWELDALDPRVLTALIEEHIKARRDRDAWKVIKDQEKTDKAQILRLAQSIRPCT